MTSRIWRPWYHSMEAWHLHQRVLREGPLFHAVSAAIPAKVKLLRPIPHYLQANWQRYQQVPAASHFRHKDCVLSQVDDQYYLFGSVQGDELHVQDFLQEDIAEKWRHR